MKTTWRIFWIVVSIFIMGVVFYFSSQNSGNSEDLSDSVAELLNMEQKEEYTRVSNQNLFLGLTLRKVAHIVLFAGLGFSLFMAFTGVKGRIIWALGIAYVYGVLDELHQTLTGRYGRWQDTLIDLLGAVIGVGTALLILLIWKRKARMATLNKKTRQV